MERKVLIVEDDYLYSLLLKKELSPYDINICDIVNSGELAIKSNLKHHPDFILMDVKLSPSMDGIKTAVEIRKSNNAKIIFMTGYAIEEIAASVKNQQIDNVLFLEKPINPQVIKKIIKEE